MGKIKISQDLWDIFRNARMPDAILDRYYEVDKTKPKIEIEVKYTETNEPCPWDKEVKDD